MSRENPELVEAFAAHRRAYGSGGASQDDLGDTPRTRLHGGPCRSHSLMTLAEVFRRGWLPAVDEDDVDEAA